MCLTVVENDHVEGPALKKMREEASRIWARQRLTLIWTTAGDKRCDSVTTVVLDDARLSALGRGQRDTALAKTVFLGLNRTIVVSARKVSRMVTARRATLEISTAGAWDDRTGTLLGRVIAHEVGHVILATLSHAESGLMRANFGVDDLLSDDDRLFDLTPADKLRVATRFSLSAPQTLTMLTQVGLH
jgi:hypothetical protein